MSEPNSQGEPTMEEILASIRKIISEDGPEAEAEAAGEAETAEAAPVEEPAEEPVEEPAAAAVKEPPAEKAVQAKPAPAPDEDEDVLDLTQEVKEDGTVVDLNAKRDEAAEAKPAPEPEPEEEPSELEFAESARAEPEAEPEIELPDDDLPEPEMPEPEPEIAASVPAAEEPSLVSGETRSAATASLVELAMTAGLGAAGRDGSSVAGQTLEMLVRDALRPYLKSWLDENLAPLVERIVREEIQKMVKRAEYR